MLHKAHIFQSPRIEDIRAVIVACPWCHGTSHRLKMGGIERPKITVENLLWAKHRFDEEHYDRVFLRRYSVAELPAVAPPSSIYLAEYRERRGR
jgi:hypothetical protein